MRDLLDPKDTPRVPSAIRRRAYSVLKHYPSNLDLYRIAQEPGDFLESDIFQKEMERYRK